MTTLMLLFVADAIYVAADGKDTTIGTVEQPVASIARAIELARASRAHTIIVGPGEYSIKSSIVLDARDSGLTIKASKGPRPLITGALVVEDKLIQETSDPALRDRVTKLNKDSRAYEVDLSRATNAELAPYSAYGFSRPIIAGPSELFADTTPMTIARWPNTGFSSIKSVKEPGNGEADRDKPPRMPIFTGISDRAKAWKSVENAWLFGYWKFDWADETIKIQSVDPQSGEITLATPHIYGVVENAPFFAENVPEELDAVGEYFLDVTKRQLRFVTSKSAHPKFRLSMCGTPLITLSHADNVHVQGLDFGYSRGDGVSIDACEASGFEGCKFMNLGERGAVIKDGHGSGLTGCDIWNTAEGGVSLNGGVRATLTPGGNFVTNCDIHHYQRRAQTYRPGVLLNGVGNIVSHCAIHDSPHSAIIFGGNEHTIELNEFFRTISRTGDGGVVYTGRDWSARGTSIRKNYFHDNIGQGKWEPAIYFDDLASGLTATGNVIERCHWGFHIGGGRDNVFSDNQIIDCKLAFHCDARGLGWAGKSKPTMVSNLNAVPFKTDPWKSKYPQLVDLLEHDPMAPSGNTISGNRLIRSGTLKSGTDPAFEKTTKYFDNTESTATSFAVLPPTVGLIADATRKSLKSR